MGQSSTMKVFRPMRHYRGRLQIETPLGIVNIRVRLTDHSGRSVDSIEVQPDTGVVRYGFPNTRLVRVGEPTGGAHV
jgi:hypothetical protein